MRFVLLLFAVAALAMAGVTGVERWRFAREAVPMDGQVVEVESRNARCGRKPRRACTKFTAIVAYAVAGSTRQVRLGAGQERGRNEPISEARHQVGDRIALRVHPRTGEAHADTTAGVWGLPILLAVFGGLLGLGGLLGARRR